MKSSSQRTVVSLIAVLSVIGIAVSLAADRSPIAEPKIKWAAPAEGFVSEKTLATYRAVPSKEIGRERAHEMLEQLIEATDTKASFDGLQEADDRLIFTSSDDASAVFDVDLRTGTFLFNSGLDRYSGEASTRDLPTNKDAPDVALEYLAKLRYLPEDREQLVVGRVGGLAMAAAKEGESSGPYQKLVTVYFGRVLDGLPVRGRGSRMLVHLGESSSLFGVTRSWAELEARKADQNGIKSDDVILGEIRRRLFMMAGEAEVIVVEKADLVLFDDGRGVVEPAIYVVAAAQYEGPERAGGSVRIPVDFYIPVLLESEGYYPFHQDVEARWPGSETKDRGKEE